MVASVWGPRPPEDGDSVLIPFIAGQWSLPALFPKATAEGEES